MFCPVYYLFVIWFRFVLFYYSNAVKSDENKYYIAEHSKFPLFLGKYYFTTDPRVKVGDPFLNFSQDELIEYAQYITAPIFIAKAKGGSYYEVKENFYEVLDVLKRTSTDCYFNYVEGTHHVHLNNPENVAELMVNFIRRHNIEDRSIGGIRKEIILDNPELSQVYLKS